MTRAACTFFAVLCIAAMLRWYIDFGVHPAAYWLGAFLLGAVAAVGNRSGAAPGSRASSEFLCDTCKYNDARYCVRPERPNADQCPDYKKHL